MKLRNPSIIGLLLYLAFVVYNLYVIYRILVTVHAYPFGQ